MSPAPIGRSKAQAGRLYYEPLQRAISCFARNTFFRHSGFDEHIRAESLALTGDSVVLRDDAGVPQLALVPTIHYRIEQLGPKRWMARTAGYTYRLEDPHEPDKGFVRYDWHPWVTETGFPHVHLLTAPHGSDRLHIATGHVTLREVLTMARRDFGVKPIRDDWAAALDAADAVLRA